MELLLRYVCGGDKAKLYRLITAWAIKYQRPMQKLHCITVFRGKPGAGKNALVQLHERICGPRMLKATGMQQLNWRYSRGLKSAVWIVLDEAMFPGDDESITLLQKLVMADDWVYDWVDDYPQPFHADVILTVDESWVTPAVDDCPFLVLDVQLPVESLYMFDSAPEFLHLLQHWPIPNEFEIART